MHFPFHCSQTPCKHNPAKSLEVRGRRDGIFWVFCLGPNTGLANLNQSYFPEIKANIDFFEGCFKRLFFDLSLHDQIVDLKPF